MTGFHPTTLALLDAVTEAEWERAPFMRRARDIHERQDLPDWKVPETVRSLERIFVEQMKAGKSGEQAFEHLDSQIQRLFPRDQ